MTFDLTRQTIPENRPSIVKSVFSSSVHGLGTNKLYVEFLKL